MPQSIDDVIKAMPRYTTPLLTGEDKAPKGEAGEMEAAKGDERA